MGAGARISPGRRAARRRQRRRAWATGIVATLAVAGLLATAFLLSGSETPARPQVKGEQVARPPAFEETTTSPSSTLPSSTTAPTTRSTGGAAPATTSPTQRTATTGGAGPGPGPSTTVPPSVQVTRALGWTPGLVTDDGTITWAVDLLESGRIARLDDAGHVLASGHVAAFVSGLGAIGDGAWLLRSSCPSGAAQLVHVDAAARPTATFALPDALSCDVAPGRSALAVAGGRIWVAAGDPSRPGAGLLLGVEPGSGTVAARVPLAGVPRDVRADAGLVWVTLDRAPSASPGELVVGGFDPTGGHQVDRVVVRPITGLPIVAGGAVWFGDAGGLQRVAASGATAQHITVDGPGCTGGALFGFVPVSVGGVTVWGTRLEQVPGGPTGPVTKPAVCRLDLRTGRAMGWNPGALSLVAADDTGAWLADQTGAGLVRWTTN